MFCSDRSFTYDDAIDITFIIAEEKKILTDKNRIYRFCQLLFFLDLFFFRSLVIDDDFRKKNVVYSLFDDVNVYNIYVYKQATCYVS